MKLYFGCLIVAFLCLTFSTITTAVIDVEYIIACCIKGTIPQLAQGDCTAAMCAKQKADQIASFEAKFTKGLDTTVDDAAEAAKSELQAKVTHDFKKHGKIDTGVNFKDLLSGKVTAQRFEEVSLTSLEQLKNKIQTRKAASRNPVVAATELWPKGIIPFKWSGTLKPYDGDLTAVLVDATNRDALTFINLAKAMAIWESKTCIRFKHDQGAGTVVIDSADGSETNDNGKACNSVKVLKRVNTESTSLHELGHCIGMDHTFKRSDAKNHVTIKPKECALGYLNTKCKDVASMGIDGAATQEYCEDDTNKAEIEREFVSPYDKTNAANLLACQRGKCADIWVSQYYPPSTDRIVKTYDKNSIMHYKFKSGDLAPCLSNPDIIDISTPGERVTDIDIEIVNEVYGCLKWTVEYDSGNLIDGIVTKTIEVYVHPDWSLGEATAYLKKASNGDADGILNKKTGSTYTQPIVLTASGYGNNAQVKLIKPSGK